ncbi:MULTISPECIES: hypothetical protein [Bifidobacterium]|jgi:hypothetical protein|uniref:Uncharacterized protein n=1 Tax=Bifidobacterium tibiigranuli TaxID=2172043 RepID=A0A5N6S228_9BIFI|nr:hypothetical protein [Bifidobacterium tibiigranuli]KAE8128323.1 hypothetical protein DDE84_05320 [Bifidobacterium tibiigranuli]KAE8128662.1 hypothetical protein DDF78_06025 [Bifidobacterium tibiigranuli]MCH3974834.1 hypothetical protein [Bifidobacterium tibiigranuli]MCH4190245.1 hypothetical protein [Bifidobacterium tibiigranuli]MCH4202593.1 hypothetical protein [Bifidobacterium tibiigranuli]
MTLQKLNDLDIGVISDQLGSQLRDQLGNQFSAQTDNLKSMLRDAAQTAQTKNPFPLSEQEKKTTGDTLVAFGVASVLLFVVFLFYRAIVKSGVKAALKEHDKELAGRLLRHHRRHGRPALEDFEDEEDG